MTGNKAVIVRRLAMLLRYAEKRTYALPLKVLARGLNVSERTVRRDLEALEAAGYALPKWRHDE